MNHDDPEPKIQWLKMIGVSLTINAAIIGGIVVFASGSAPQHALYAPSINVSLYGPGKIRQEDRGGPDGTATVKSKSTREQVIEKTTTPKLEKAVPVQSKIIVKPGNNTQFLLERESNHGKRIQRKVGISWRLGNWDGDRSRTI